MSILVDFHTGPVWHEVWKKHVTGLYVDAIVGKDDKQAETRRRGYRMLFCPIFELKLGKSLLFHRQGRRSKSKEPFCSSANACAMQMQVIHLCKVSHTNRDS